jgi:surface antigen
MSSRGTVSALLGCSVLAFAAIAVGQESPRDIQDCLKLEPRKRSECYRALIEAGKIEAPQDRRMPSQTEPDDRRASTPQATNPRETSRRRVPAEEIDGGVEPDRSTRRGRQAPETTREATRVTAPSTQAYPLANATNVQPAETRYTDAYPFPDSQPYIEDRHEPLARDPWGFYNRECTSYVAWRLNNYFGKASFGGRAGFYNGIGETVASPPENRFSNAHIWRKRAQALGYRVVQTPREGAVAYWDKSTAPGMGLGHVAFVEKVNEREGWIEVTEYNYSSGHRFGSRRIYVGSGGSYPDAFLLIQGPPPNAQANNRNTVAPPPASPAPPPSQPAIAIPSKPANLSPGSMRNPGPEQSSTTVRLSWHKVAGADEYDFGIRDMIANNLVVDRRTAQNSYTTRLEPGRTYRWNIRSCNSAGCSDFTAPLYFSTPPESATTSSNNSGSTPSPQPSVSVPATPRAMAPGSLRSPGSATSDTNVRIEWSSVAGAEEYDFGIRDLTSNRLVIDDRSRRTSYTAKLRSGSKYRWNVRACNAAGCSEFTAPLYFSTPEDTTSAVPSSGNSGGTASNSSQTVPATPRGLSPGRSSSPGTTLKDTIVRINWDDVDGAAEYDFGIRDMTTNTLVVDDQSARSSYTARLKAGRTYRWNVRACNRSGCSDFSRPLYFTVAD